MTDDPSTTETPGPAAPPGPVLLRGTSINAGLAMGPARRKDDDLSRVRVRRVAREGVERELNRFHRALSESRQQLEELKQRLSGVVPEGHVMILDTHVAYLRDSVFLSDVENLILGEQMSLESAIAKVIGDFDRIFRLVESETLRARAVDLRDVGIRVLRNLARNGESEEPEREEVADHVLIARELSIVDMFGLHGERVAGILTEEGSLTGHAAILARSMRIPTLTAIEGLLEEVSDGDFVILDATEGVVRVRPDEVVRDQYRAARDARRAQDATGERPAWADVPATTGDGEAISVSAICGNLPEVERAAELGMTGIGLYRTELLYLLDRDEPSLDSLAAHYRSVLRKSGGGPEDGVTFRLLDVDSSFQVPYLHEEREQNPGLGRLGVRALLEREGVLRRQLQAILCAAEGVRARIAVPKIVDCGELRRVKEILFEERLALKKASFAHAEEVEIGVVVETPAAALGARSLVAEADFLVVSLNSLQQYVLAADRDNASLSSYFAHLHPVVVRVLRELAATCVEQGKSPSVFGVSAVAPENLALLLGVGLRHFHVSPVTLERFLETARRVDLREASRLVELALRSACPSEMTHAVEGYRHGFAR